MNVIKVSASMYRTEYHSLLDSEQLQGAIFAATNPKDADMPVSFSVLCKAESLMCLLKLITAHSYVELTQHELDAIADQYKNPVIFSC